MSLGDHQLAKLVSESQNKRAIAKTIIGYVDENGHEEFFTGESKGVIVSPTGEGGFGWDKIFKPDGFEKTYGEMTREEKNKISMRKIALEKLAAYLKGNI